MNDAPHKVTRLKSKPIPLRFAKEQIDFEEGVLKDVVMLQEGPAKGHGYFLEAEFVEAITKYDQKKHKDRGLKARFDHPGMCDGTMGSQLGKFFNFRTRKAEVIDAETKEKKVVLQEIADLHLLESADKSPNRPGMKTWMLSMAEESPDFLMSSIVFRFTAYYQRDKKGKKKYIYRYEKYEDEEGVTRERYVGKDPELGKVYIEFGEKGIHLYTDIVEAGAATDELFSAQFNADNFGVQASEWLRENEQILNFIKNNPEKLNEVFENLGIDFPIKKQNPMGALKDLLFGKGNTTEEVTEETQELQTDIQETKDEIAKLTKERDDAQAELKKATDQVDAFKKKNAELETRVSALEKQPAANHTEGETETGNGEADQPEYYKSAINQKAMEIHRRNQKGES